MPDEIPLEPRFVIWRCDHCRNGIEFDAVQLVGRTVCYVTCPHCGRATGLQEPLRPPRLVPDEGWALPVPGETTVAPVAKKVTESPKPVVVLTPPEATKPPLKVLAVTPPPSDTSPPPPEKPAPQPAEPKPITINLPPDPPPPPRTGGKVDVRWLTDLGVVYFRQHQFTEAFLCFSRAAQQGFATAQFCLAVCYMNGHGTAQDDAAAFPWLQQAAAQGDANAEFTLGMAYRLGRSVIRNESLAAQWMQKAAQHGHPEAIRQTGETNPTHRATAETVAAPAATPASTSQPSPAKDVSKPRHDLQRLILGLFKKKS